MEAEKTRRDARDMAGRDADDMRMTAEQRRQRDRARWDAELEDMFDNMPV